jgi:hypothetical protein
MKRVTNLVSLRSHDPKATAGKLMCCNAMQFDALTPSPLCENFVFLHRVNWRLQIDLVRVRNFKQEFVRKRRDEKKSFVSKSTR